MSICDLFTDSILLYIKNTQNQEHHKIFGSSKKNMYIQGTEIPITWLSYCAIFKFNHLYAANNFKFTKLPLNLLEGGDLGSGVFLIASENQKHNQNFTSSAICKLSSFWLGNWLIINKKKIEDVLKILSTPNSNQENQEHGIEKQQSQS